MIKYSSEFAIVERCQKSVLLRSLLRRMIVHYNRVGELGYLNTRYAGRRAELVILYGRRRVGKTSLVHHWVQDKPHLFFFATEDDSATLLRRLSQ